MGSSVPWIEVGTRRPQFDPSPPPRRRSSSYRDANGNDTKDRVSSTRSSMLELELFEETLTSTNAPPSENDDDDDGDDASIITNEDHTSMI